MEEDAQTPTEHVPPARSPGLDRAAASHRPGGCGVPVSFPGVLLGLKPQHPPAFGGSQFDRLQNLP